MKNKLATASLACILLTLAICWGYYKHNNAIQQDIKHLMETGLDLSVLPPLCHTDYTILRYAKPSSCTSCHLQMGQWKVFQRKMLKAYGNRLQFHYIIDTQQPQEAKRICGTHQFAKITTIDSISKFIDNNPQVTPFGDDVVMLLDKKLSVIAVGNPCKNPQAADLYNRLIQEGITSTLK